MAYQVDYRNKKVFLEEAMKRYYIRFSKGLSSEAMTTNTGGGSYQSGGNLPPAPTAVSGEETSATHAVQMEAIPVPQKDPPKMEPPKPVTERVVDLSLRWRINTSVQITSVHHGQEVLFDGSLLTGNFYNRYFRVQDQTNPTIVADIVGNNILEKIYDYVLGGANNNYPGSPNFYHPEGRIERLLDYDNAMPAEPNMNSRDFIDNIANDEYNRNILNQNLYRSINTWLRERTDLGSSVTVENFFSLDQTECNILYKDWKERDDDFELPERWGRQDISNVFDMSNRLYVISIGTQHNLTTFYNEWENDNQEPVDPEGKIGLLHVRLTKVELEVMLDEVEQ